ncbi:dienelactone hydrolase family protein [Rhodoferax sp.]|uniref:dienelactone hydrolase family protein n=1 Tax=Rhodoferax sp. TaxID=50421 RepID=UPI001EC0FBF4|nr:dienelactone hydrolase family protein [Rhodoferax sp.]MBT9507099.1 dienelactone hydrolase family protein [Rhodoferax sp.]
MIDREIDITTPDGLMNTFITHPEEGGPHPVVIFYMDAPGKREELHDMARRLGSAGYYVILPNLYYRRDRDFRMGTGDEARKLMFEHMGSLNKPKILTDTAALLAFVDQDPAAKAGKAGVVGYCMSGPFVFWAGAQHPDRIAAVASFHGVHLCTEEADSPHRTVDRIQGEVYVGCAQTDVWAPSEMIAALDAHLRTTRLRYRIETYADTQHGFVFPLRQGMYQKAGAERHWERLHALLQRNLV